MSAAFQVLTAVAALSWLCVLAVALTVGVRVALKIRARRRRIKRLLNACRLSGLVSERAVVRSAAAVRAFAPPRTTRR
jgi:hypothetical protein